MRVYTSMCCALAVLCIASTVWATEDNEDVRLDSMMTHHRAKRVLCNSMNSVSGANQKAMASTFGMMFGKRGVLNCTYPTGVYGDACDSPPPPPKFPIIWGKRQESQFQGKPKRDIVFVVDDSGSISEQNFEKAKEGVINLLSSFCPQKLGPKDKQIAVVMFSTEPRTVVSFNDSQKGVNWVAKKIKDEAPSKGSTTTSQALRYVRKNILASKKARLSDPDTSTHVIVVTDGKCNQLCDSLDTEAEKLRDMGPGVQLFALGVSSSSRACELDIITGNGANLAFGVSDFDTFESFAKAMRQVAKDEFNGCI